MDTGVGRKAGADGVVPSERACARCVCALVCMACVGGCTGDAFVALAMSLNHLPIPWIKCNIYSLFSRLLVPNWEKVLSNWAPCKRVVSNNPWVTVVSVTVKES